MATSLNQNCQQEGSSTTVVQNDISEEQVSSGVVRLRLQAKPSDQKKVKWTTDTVDNEHMNRKKSKCCCVYVRPKAFDESSSEEEEDGECEHCSGHVEAKKGSQEQHNEDVQPSSSQT